MVGVKPYSFLITEYYPAYASYLHAFLKPAGFFFHLPDLAILLHYHFHQLLDFVVFSLLQQPFVGGAPEKRPTPSPCRLIPINRIVRFRFSWRKFGKPAPKCQQFTVILLWSNAMKLQKKRHNRMRRLAHEAPKALLDNRNPYRKETEFVFCWKKHRGKAIVSQFRNRSIIMLRL